MEHIKNFIRFVKEEADYRNVTGFGTMGNNDQQNAGPKYNMGPDPAVYARPDVVGVESTIIEDPYFNERKRKRKRPRKNPKISKLRKSKSKYFRNIDLKTREKMIENINEIDPYGEENWEDDDNSIIINEIKYLVNKYGGYITMRDLEADASPCVKVDDDGIHLIERLFRDSVEVIIYGGYKNEEEVGEYEMSYEELIEVNGFNMNILEEIKNLIDNAIQFDLLEEDI